MIAGRPCTSSRATGAAAVDAGWRASGSFENDGRVGLTALALRRGGEGCQGARCTAAP